MRYISKGIILAVFIAAAVARVGADTLTASIYLTNNTGPTGYSYSNGGEFQAYNIVGLTVAPEAAAILSGTAQVFCVEYNEEFSPGNQYWVQLDDGAKFDGVPNGFNSLTPQAAYLFHRFWTGDLANDAHPYDYAPGAGREASAGDLQLALWHLQNEANIPAMTAGAQAWYDEANSVVAAHQWSGIGNVRVLHLWTDATDQDFAHRAQDQLVEIPTPPVPSAPLPSTPLAGLVLIALIASPSAIKSVDRRGRALLEHR
jgi:hypothetical protein